MLPKVNFQGNRRFIPPPVTFARTNVSLTPPGEQGPDLGEEPLPEAFQSPRSEHEVKVAEAMREAFAQIDLLAKSVRNPQDENEMRDVCRSLAAIARKAHDEGASREQVTLLAARTNTCVENLMTLSPHLGVLLHLEIDGAKPSLRSEAFGRALADIRAFNRFVSAPLHCLESINEAAQMLAAIIDRYLGLAGADLKEAGALLAIARGQLRRLGQGFNTPPLRVPLPGGSFLESLLFNPDFVPPADAPAASGRTVPDMPRPHPVVRLRLRDLERMLVAKVAPPQAVLKRAIPDIAANAGLYRSLALYAQACMPTEWRAAFWGDAAVELKEVLPPYAN